MVKMWDIVGQTPTWRAPVTATAYDKRTRFQRDYNLTLVRAQKALTVLAIFFYA